MNQGLRIRKVVQSSQRPCLRISLFDFLREQHLGGKLKESKNGNDSAGTGKICQRNNHR